MAEQMTLEQAIEIIDDHMVHGAQSDSGKAWNVVKAHLNAAKGEAVAWQFQQSETGLMCELSNDGINTPESFLANNPRHRYIGPLYTAPPSTDAEDARRLDWLERQYVEVRTPLRYGSCEKFSATPGDDEVKGLLPSDLRAKIDAAMQGESHDH